MSPSSFDPRGRTTEGEAPPRKPKRSTTIGFDAEFRREPDDQRQRGERAETGLWSVICGVETAEQSKMYEMRGKAADKLEGELKVLRNEIGVDIGKCLDCHMTAVKEKAST